MIKGAHYLKTSRFLMGFLYFIIITLVISFLCGKNELELEYLSKAMI